MWQKNLSFTYSFLWLIIFISTVIFLIKANSNRLKLGTFTYFHFDCPFLGILSAICRVLADTWVKIKHWASNHLVESRLLYTIAVTIQKTITAWNINPQFIPNQTNNNLLKALNVIIVKPIDVFMYIIEKFFETFM